MASSVMAATTSLVSEFPLDSVVHAFQQGESPEGILRSFPKNEPASWRPGVSKAILKVRFLADAKLPQATIPVRMKDPAEAKDWVNRMEWPLL